MKLWPSGDFTIGLRTPPRRDKGDNPLGGIERDAFGVVFKHRAPQPAGSIADQIKICERLVDLADQRGDIQERDRLATKLADLYRNMGLLALPNSRNRAQKRGGKGISADGKRMVRSCAVLLERQYRGRLGFGTCTLPALAPRDMKRVCQGWGQLTKRFFEELGRELARNGLPTDFVYVTEIQPERFKAWGQIAPHLHFLYVGKPSKWSRTWCIPKEWFRDCWSRLLSNYLGHRVGVPNGTRVEGAIQSPVAELGKYMSKGGEALFLVKQMGRSDELPSSYWGATRSLRAQVRRECLVSHSQAVGALMDALPELKKMDYLRYRQVCRQIPGDSPNKMLEIDVGYAGYIYREKIPDVIRMATERWLFANRNLRKKEIS